MLRLWFIIVGVSSTFAAIYHLNDTEYERMPPLFFLDDYESCMSTYCVLQLNLYAKPGNQLMRMITEYSDYKYKHYNHALIGRGVCLKTACRKFITTTKTTEGLKSSLEACLNYSLQKEYGLNAKVSTLYYCDNHTEPRNIDIWDWIVLIIIVLLAIMNIIGSAYDYFANNTSETNLLKGNNFLITFSVMRHWKRLINTQSNDPKTGDFQFFHGIRCMTILATILVHAYMTLVNFSGNPHYIEETYEHPVFLLVINGLMVIQIFFFISGFLTAYNFQTEEEKRTLTFWDLIKIIVLRITRLVPALAITLALATTWVRHLGSGPLWNLIITSTMVRDCRKQWWQYLLLINNYSDESRFCLLPIWQVAAVFQVFVVCVTAYILTQGRTRQLVLSALFFLSAAAPALNVVLQDLDIIIVTPEAIRTMTPGPIWIQRVSGHTNLPCFILGMISATRFYDWQKKGGHHVQSKWYGVVQYLSLLPFLVIVYSGSVFYRDGYKPSLLVRVAYVTATPILFGLLCMLTIPAFLTKTPTLMKSMFEWKYWIVFSRLTYSVCLLHMMIAYVIMGLRSQLSYFSFFNLTIFTVVLAVISYTVAVPFYLTVEAPFTTFFTKMFKKYKNGEMAISEVGKNARSAVKSEKKKV